MIVLILWRAHLMIGFLLLVLCGHCIAQDTFVDGVDLTTVSAPWTMRILGNDLDITNVQVKPDERSAYFMMASASTKLNVSVFIEPIDKCKSSDECRDFVLNLGNPAWGKFGQLAKGKLKDFSYFEFYRSEVQGQPLKILDMYAEYVSQGYWVDLHISKMLYTKADHALFEKVVNSINFLQQGISNSAFDTQSAKGRAAVTSWLGLWDKGRCKESYAALASLSRAGITEQDWTEYCNRMNKDLGANRSRKLVAAAYARSLPDKTARPLAILAYRSAFANEPVVAELISLLLEKDGTWMVTNYVLP
jgi:Protein of unknown function (DUF4019)